MCYSHESWVNRHRRQRWKRLLRRRDLCRENCHHSVCDGRTKRVTGHCHSERYGRLCESVWNMPAVYSRVCSQGACFDVFRSIRQNGVSHAWRTSSLKLWPRASSLRGYKGATRSSIEENRVACSLILLTRLDGQWTADVKEVFCFSITSWRKTHDFMAGCCLLQLTNKIKCAKLF